MDSILSENWIHKTYFLGYCFHSSKNNFPASIFFYSHNKRFELIIDEDNGALVYRITEVEKFILSDEMCIDFSMNVNFRKEANFHLMLYKELPEELLDELDDDFFMTLPRPSDINHENDVVMYDSLSNSFVVLSSEKIKDYLHCDLFERFIFCQQLYGYSDLKNIADYPELMVNVLKGEKMNHLGWFDKKLLNKRIKYLGLKYIPLTKTSRSSELKLFFKDESKICVLSINKPEGSINIQYQLDFYDNVEECLNENGTLSTEFYIYCKDIVIDEYHIIQGEYDSAMDAWERPSSSKEIKLTFSSNANVDFIYSDVFVIDLSGNYEAQIDLSNMKEISGSSYKVKRKRFIEAISPN